MVEAGPRAALERDSHIQQALSVLRSRQWQIGERHSRIHPEAMENRAAMIKALERGPCRDCGHLLIDFVLRGRRLQVVLKCRAGGSPLGLHRPYVFRPGEVPECELVDRAGVEPATSRMPCERSAN